MSSYLTLVVVLNRYSAHITLKVSVLGCLQVSRGSMEKIQASLNAKTASSGLADLFHTGFNTNAKVLLLTTSPG